QAAGMLRTAGKGKFELSPEILCVRMAEQELRRRFRIGSDVESFVAANASERAGGDVAHDIAARLARRDPDSGETPHQRRRVFDMDEVILDVLSRGDVRDSVGVFLREICERLHLLCVEAAERNFDAHHTGRIPDGVRAFCKSSRGDLQLLNFLAVVALAIVVALAVYTAPKARLGENPLIDLPLLSQFH